MHSGGEPLLLRDALAQIAQLYPFVFVQRSTEALLMLGCDSRHFAQNLSSVVCELQLVIPPVLGAPSAIDDPLALQCVYECNHATGHYAEVFR